MLVFGVSIRWFVVEIGPMWTELPGKIANKWSFSHAMLYHGVSFLYVKMYMHVSTYINTPPHNSQTHRYSILISNLHLFSLKTKKVEVPSRVSVSDVYSHNANSKRVKKGLLLALYLPPKHFI